MKLRLDLHVHTDLSQDSSTSLSDMLHAAKLKGLSGLAVTNHNVCTPSAQEEGLFIIPAAEYTTDAGHLLCYFLTAPLEKGLSKDEQGRYSWQEIVSRAHAQGALVFLAHPFAPCVERDNGIYAAIDGVEVYNARIVHSRADRPNDRAQALCLAHQKACAAGSDAHFADEVGAAYWVCDVPTEGRTAHEVLDDIKFCLQNNLGRIYGGTASPIFRPMGQWVKLKKTHKKHCVFRLIPRFLRALYLATKGRKMPEEILFQEK